MIEAVNKNIKAKEYFADNHGHNILKLFDTFPFFFSPDVKQRVIISNKHGIYELPHELPHELTLRFLGNLERSGKSQNFI